MPKENWKAEKKEKITIIAIAVLKYSEDELAWFHFEIFDDSNGTSIVEHYDDSYDQIIEDYYKELTTQFK